MINFSTEQIQYLKETYGQRSYLGIPKYSCKDYNMVHLLYIHTDTGTIKPMAWQGRTCFSSYICMLLLPNAPPLEKNESSKHHSVLSSSYRRFLFFSFSSSKRLTWALFSLFFLLLWFLEYSPVHNCGC